MCVMRKKHSVLIISHSNGSGGAARAATRLYTCLSSDRKVGFIVASKSGNDSNIRGPKYLVRKFGSLLSQFDVLVARLIQPGNTEWQSTALFGRIRATTINKHDFSIINLHWIGHALISLQQIKKITKPIVWTLHDEWLLNAISHYPEKLASTHSRPSVIERMAHRIKNHQLQTKFDIICKKNMYLVCLNSEIFNKIIKMFPGIKERVFIIPNPVDLTKFYPISDVSNGHKIEFFDDKPLLLFLGGDTDIRKGWDLLEQALNYCKSSFTLILVGSKIGEPVQINENIKIIRRKGIDRIDELRNLYVRANAVVIPSRIEGLPQVATEAISSGTPVVGFSIGGLKDIIHDGITGLLVEPYDVKKLSQAIDDIFLLDRNAISTSCRNYALANFDFGIVRERYEVVFKKAINSSHTLFF